MKSKRKHATRNDVPPQRPSMRVHASAQILADFRDRALAYAAGGALSDAIDDGVGSRAAYTLRFDGEMYVVWVVVNRIKMEK